MAEIRGKSAKSSLNLARVLSSLDWSKNGECVHVSLTYHNAFPVGKRELGLEKQKLAQAMARKIAGFWMLEFQERMAPHFHLLAWLGSLSRADFEQWATDWWQRASGNSSDYAIKITSGDQVRGVWYLCMHAAKRQQSPDFRVGRWWGYINRKRVLKAQDVHRVADVEDRQRVWWARLFRRATGCKTRVGQGFSWFLPRSYQCVVWAWVSQRQYPLQISGISGRRPCLCGPLGRLP